MTQDDENTNIILPESASQLELALSAWWSAKSKRTGSIKTAEAYRTTMLSFRQELHRHSLDLDAPAPIIATLAQQWADTRASDRDAPVEPTTYNQRLAIISSFYGYARKQGLFSGENPISRVERRPAQGYASSYALEYDEVKTRLAQVDRTTLAGKRDYAVLAVFLQTGRRLSEVNALQRRDLRFSHNGSRLTLHFRRTKGGKAMSDMLPAPVSRAVLEWLATFYKIEPSKLGEDMPIWVSLSPRNYGKPVSIQTLADICEKHLGISKVHTLRHTFARAMEDSGAKVSDIQARLGHTSLATTGRYLAALRQADNPQADALSKIFGIE